MFPKFIWDPAKARANWRKHGVTFEEAVLAFDDPDGIAGIDLDLSYGETRYTHFGQSRSGLLKVIYVERGQFIRIISARKASRHEEKEYFAERFR